MKLYKVTFALILGIGSLTSCSEKLDLANPNEPTTATFGNTVDDLEEAVIACYHHMRMEGTYARVGYAHDAVRGDEMWNPQHAWYLGIDHFNAAATYDVAADWIWRDQYFAINVCNFVITKCGEDDTALTETMKRIKGQALFLRGVAYFNLANYYQNPALITSYNDYSTMEGLYAYNWQEGDEDEFDQYDRVMDQVEKDFEEALELLPTKDLGGEWSKGRANKGAAAGFYARALMQRHKYSEALDVLKTIIAGTYGKYELMKDYGDNFREGSAYENNAESLFEIQFMDYGTQQGSDDEWTQVNVSKNSAQGHALEANFAGEYASGWADLSASPWLYHLYKSQRTKGNSLDPRLYWTIATYEPEWDNYAFGNSYYTETLTEEDYVYVKPAPGETPKQVKSVTRPSDNGGLPIAKWTNLRTNLYSSAITGLRCGINLRLMRYSDVLLRAAECENEVKGPTQQAIDWINEVRRRANLEDLQLSDYVGNADKLFEQIANVERPTEFGCEHGRGFDLIRWGFFHTPDRLKQMKEHSAYILTPDCSKVKDEVKYGDTGVISSFDDYVPGHEFLPIFQPTLNNNANLRGNSANLNRDNSGYFSKKGWKIHPVVELPKK